ncbi:BnaC08g44340D [Brassica napus]|nr:unnamed protein product [Brassica napus]CDY10017.1 BnaC08g44340D [Brassica napus]VDD59466.1 unnamed protein product [Brassica oleracea]
MISDVEAAHILIAMSRSKPRVVVKTIEKENTLPVPVPVPVPVPKQKRSSFRKMRRSFPMHPSCLTTAIVEYVSQEDASPPLSRKKRPPPFPPIAKQPKKKAKVVSASSWATEPTPDWLLKLVEGEEDEPKRIIEKELSATDVNHNHNRLSMPCSKIIDLEFLSIAEQGLIEVDEGKKHKTGVNARLVVKFVDSDDLKKFSVNLRRWKMPKEKGSPTFIYNLVTGWNKVVEGCGLGENDKIRLWSYHSDGELCFALVLETPAPLSHPLLLPPPSDSEDANPEEMSSALVIYDKSSDDLRST